MPRLSPPAPRDSLRHHPAFVAFWLAGIASGFGFQMVSVAVGWQIYAVTGRAFDLGLIGLVQFVPSLPWPTSSSGGASRFTGCWSNRRPS
jgi:hypothetical protein